MTTRSNMLVACRKLPVARRAVLLGCLASPVLASPTRAQGGGFPSRPIRLVLGAGPGSAPDVAARLMSERLSALWRQPVVIDNRPAANGNLAAQLVAGAEADGHALLFAQASILILNEFLMRNPGFAAERDFAPLSMLMATPFLIATRPGLPANTLSELVAMARARPGQMTFATSSGTNLPRFAGELLKRAAGIDMVNVPYSSIAGAVQDTIAGRTDIMIEGTPVLSPQVRAGAMKPIAITSAQPFPGLEVAPVALDFPGFNSVGWFGLVGPKAMPTALVQRIAGDVRAVLAVPEMRDRLARDFGAETVASEPDDFAGFLARERETYGRLIRELGVVID